MKPALRTGLLALLLAMTGGAVSADVSPGSYLAARAAESDNDLAKAAEYFLRALRSDPDNTELMEQAARAYVGLGRFDRALPIAARLTAAGVDSQTAAMVRIEEWAKAGDFAAILKGQAEGKLKIAPLVDGLVAAWAELGSGNSTGAMAGFDQVAEKAATRAFGLYHKALALALVGDYEAADAILSSETNEGLTLTRRGVLAHVEVLSQLGRNADAAKRLTDTFGADLDPSLAALKTRLDTGETLPMTVVTRPADGLAEVFFTVATALNGDTPDAFVLGFTRTAEALQPDHVDAILLSASLLERMKRYDLALATYDRIPADSPYFHVAELGRADALQGAGKTDEAIEVLQRLARTHDTIPGIFATLGDALRKAERWADAARAYDRAIDLFGAPAEGQWVVYFSRGITHEREGDWALAEADLRMALKLRPDQPQVLNYLGYSYVDMGQNLGEALGMIQRAVAARPGDGYITDSLGWALYRLDRYDEAVGQMERAAALVPVDPVINDHLGDVYWAVGRHREAEFQWRRALSFEPEEKDAERIRRKLAVGLDKVLEDEGAKPLAVAKGG
jgi:tetratricopeptide (TPR) repeat protein